MEYFSIEHLRGIQAHAELLINSAVEWRKVETVTGTQLQMVVSQTGAVLFAGLGHGLTKAYMDWLGENAPYFMDDKCFANFGLLVGVPITQEEYEQLRLF